MRRPLPLTVLAWLFVLVGVGTLAFGAFVALLADSSNINDPFRRFRSDDLLAMLAAVVAIAGGTLLLKGSVWGRWLILAWLVFHVGVSVHHGATAIVVHALLLLVSGYFLLRPQASAYFAGGREAP